MSLRLYDGLILSDPDPDLFDIVNTVSEVITKHYREESWKIIAREFFRIVDNDHLHEGKDPDRMVILDAKNDWLTFQHSLGSTSSINDPLRFSIVFGRSHRGRVLAYPFSSPGVGYREALLETGLFQDYHYQNQADRPVIITEEEWEQQKQEWESLLDENDSLGSLPMWTMENSLENVFTQPLIFGGDVDINQYRTPRDRYVDHVSVAVHTEIDRRNKERELSGEELLDPFDEFLDHHRAIKSTVQNIEDTSLFPEPVKNFRVAYKDLPEIKEVPQEIVNRVMDVVDPLGE